MIRTRLAVSAAILAASLAVSVYAQAPAPAPAPAPAAQPPADQPPSTMNKVRSWSLKKWNAAKKEMSKDKAKWDACTAAAHEQKLKLSSKAGWAYVYDCMKKPS